MRTRFAVVTLLLAILSSAIFPAITIAQTAPPAPTTSSLIVKVVAGLTADQQTAVVTRNGGTLTSAIPALRLLVVSVPIADLSAIVANYQADPQVQSIEENRVRVSESVPSDLLYANQWALPRIGWDQVFGVVMPAGSAKVAVLDTGVDATHPELADKVLAGTSILDGSNGMTDPSGHGTWLAGIIAAQTDTIPGDGIAGVGYAGVKILPVTVLNANGEGQDSDVIAGVIWAVDHGADVILMAFSAPEFSQNLQDAIDYAWSRNVVVVAAVGNNAVSTPTFPAGDRGVMGVAATDQNDALASFSNAGQAVFIAAPGVDIQTIDTNGNYIVISGTSTSAAYVAGLAAFMKAVDPSLSNGIIVGRIARNADPAGTQEETGNGRINMPRALADTSTEFIRPAGAAPVGDGGPFVGPYVAAALRLRLGTGGNAFRISSPSGATDKTINRAQSFVITLTIQNENNAGDATRTWSGISAVLGVPAGWSKTADLSGATLGAAAGGLTTTPCASGVATQFCNYSWTVTPPNAVSTGDDITVTVTGTPSGTNNCGSAGNSCTANDTITNIDVVNPAALDITLFTAEQQGAAGDVIVKTGQGIALALTVANTAAAPGARANSVGGSSVTVTPTGTASATCGAASAATNINAGANNVYSYTCGLVSGDGTLTFRASASGTDQNTDAALSAGPETSNSITVDSTAPTSGLTPASGTVNAPFSFNWNITDPTVGGVNSGVASGTCAVTVNSVLVSSVCSGSHSLGAGVHMVVVTAQDVAGNALNDSRDYTVIADNTPPVVNLTFPAPTGLGGYFNTAPVTAQVTADDTTTGNSNITGISCPGATVGMITGLGTPSASAGVTVSGEGTHTITCTATDSAGNTGAGPGSDNTKTVNIDTVAPDTSITSNPANPTNSTSAIFSFTGSDAAPSSGGPTFECKLDGGSFGACTSPKTYNGLTDGSHTFEVRAVDTAGNMDPTPASFTWTVDRQPPQVTVMFPSPDGSNGWFRMSSVVGSVMATDPSNVSEINCTDSGGGLTQGALVGGGTSSASRSLTLAGDGIHNISCQATDGVGNSGAASGSTTAATVKIDATPPTITFTSRTPAANAFGWNNTDVIIAWACGDVTSGPASASVSQTVSTEGANQSSTGICYDNASNSASNIQTGISIDKTPPTNVAFVGGPAAGASYYFGFVPSAPTCTAQDALSGFRDCAVTGYSTAVGLHPMTATAYDKAGNSATETRSYTVLAWTLTGFYSPVDMGSYVLNSVKGGSTVPLKFEVFTGTTELTDVNLIGATLRAQSSDCSGYAEDEIEVVATGETILRYDWTSGQFIFNWKTPKTPGKCVQLTLTTADGTAISAKFKLK